MNSPCKNCKDRFIKTENEKTITCHMGCEKYDAFRTDKEAEYLARKQKNTYQEVMYDSMLRLQKNPPGRRKR